MQSATVMGPRPPLPVPYDATPSEQLLGVQYRSTEEMTQATVHSLLQNGFTAGTQYHAQYWGRARNYRIIEMIWSVYRIVKQLIARVS